MHMRPYLGMKSPSQRDHLRREAEGSIHKSRVSEDHCVASPVGSQRPHLTAEGNTPGSCSSQARDNILMSLLWVISQK